MAPRMTFEILRPESPRLEGGRGGGGGGGLAGVMGARDRKAIAHRV